MTVRSVSDTDNNGFIFDEHVTFPTIFRGGSRILQGRVSNPSKRGTGGANTLDMRAYGGGVGPSPENFNI